MTTTIKAGDKYRHWTVLDSTSFHRILVRCDCGNEKEISRQNLLWQKSKGCYKCHQFGENNHRYLGDNGNTAKKLAWLIEEKSNPCFDCGRKFPSHCMQFDHKTDDKSFEINRSSITMSYTLDELKAEREKCDLLCSNCHDHRTWCRNKGIELYPIPDDCWTQVDDGTIESALSGIRYT